MKGYDSDTVSTSLFSLLALSCRIKAPLELRPPPVGFVYSLHRMLELMEVHLIYVAVYFLTHETSYSSPAAVFANFHMAIVGSQQTSSVSFLNEHILVLLHLEVLL
jgi:hypothetical protein